MSYTKEQIDEIMALHEQGRFMSFMEFPLVGGKYVLRFLKRGDKYVCEMDGLEAAGYLKAINND